MSGEITHDKVTRFLSEEELDSKKLWKLVKSVVREKEEEDGILIVDDTIENKPYTKESELVCWHYDHQTNRSVKGINLINYIYNVGEISIPVGFDVVKKPVEFCDFKTRKQKRKAIISKNEFTRNHLAKSPTKCIRTQTNHIFMSIYAAFQLECLSLKHKMNHFALRSRIYIQALQHAMFELQSLKSA